MGNLSKLPVTNSRPDGWPWTEETDEKIYDPSLTWPKISIVTPSYNQGSFIEETIRSVLLQNYPNLEYIIIDGGSTDNTREVIKCYEPWITYWISENDRGQSHAINKGLEKCTGAIFNWLNSDDWYMQGAFFYIADAFVRNPSVKVVSGYENHIQIDGSVIEDKGTFLSEKLEETIEFCQVTQPSTFFKTEAIKSTGLLPEDLHNIMDGEMWLRFLLLYGQNCFYKISRPMANFRLHHNSKTVSNTVTDSFLYERSSIIHDLQRFVEVPGKIRDYWIADVYKTPKIYLLNRDWRNNNKIITRKRLRIHFIKKYINQQFQNNNLKDAYWGLQQLIKDFTFDFFTLKGFIKLLYKGIPRQ